MPDRFAPTALNVVVKLYDHGFTPEEVISITAKKKQLEKRNLSDEPVTLEEFKDIVVPFQRIQRTEVFNLNPEKEKKVRVLKEKVVKEKVVRLTKKFIESKITEIVYKMARGEELLEEETEFFNKHTSKEGI